MTNNATTHLQRRRELTEQLILEYADAVPPGQVLSVVVRADNLLVSEHFDAERRLATCEAVVRRRLAERAARGPRTPDRTSRPDRALLAAAAPTPS